MTSSRMTATPLSRFTTLILVAGPLAALAASLAVTSSARAEEVAFVSRSVANGANQPRTVFAADVDGDGDTDVVSASYLDDKVFWFENDGGAPLSFTRRLIAEVHRPVAVFAADVDGDGATDVLSASYIIDDLVLYQNDGGSPPTFSARQIGREATDVFATDLNGDGDTDILYVEYWEGTIWWLRNDGGSPPAFSGFVITTAGDVGETLFAKDLDGDGDPDVLGARRGYDHIVWYENLGGASPGATPSFSPHLISTDARWIRSVFAADLNADSNNDILLASQDDNRIAWFVNDGAVPPSFSEIVISNSAENALSVYASDVDGDGDMDVLSASGADDKIAWYENHGGFIPSFTERVISTSADGARAVFATDLDGDGDTDVLSASRNDNKVAWYENTCGDGVVGLTRSELFSHADPAKNRFLAVVPGSAGQPSALRVTLVSSVTYPDDVGKQWWVGEPQAVCENSGQVVPPAEGCGPAPGIPNDTFWRSALVCDQQCYDWSSYLDGDGNPLDLLYIGDADIVSGSVYEIEAINCPCDPLDPGNYSAAVAISTSSWSDTVGVSLADCPVGGPNGGPIDLVLDCVSIVQKFANLPCAPLKSRMDLHPSDPNLIIDIFDVLACLGGFSGGTYPYPAPVGCP